jgi:hypothetical protein
LLNHSHIHHWPLPQFNFNTFCIVWLLPNLTACLGLACHVVSNNDANIKESFVPVRLALVHAIPVFPMQNATVEVIRS